MLHLVEELDGVGPQPGDRVVLMRQGASVFEALETALDRACHHAHLVYYIWESDVTGARLRDALASAEEVTIEDRRNISRTRQLTESLCRVMAPLL